MGGKFYLEHDNYERSYRILTKDEERIFSKNSYLIVAEVYDKEQAEYICDCFNKRYGSEE